MSNKEKKLLNKERKKVIDKIIEEFPFMENEKDIMYRLCLEGYNKKAKAEYVDVKGNDKNILELIVINNISYFKDGIGGIFDEECNLVGLISKDGSARIFETDKKVAKKILPFSIDE